MKVWALWAEYPHLMDQATVVELEDLFTSYEKAVREKERQIQEDSGKDAIDRAYKYWIVDLEVK